MLVLRDNPIDRLLTVVTMVLPEESVVVMAEPPPTVPFEVPFPPEVLPPDMVELPELPEPPLVELVLPPIAPPVGEDPDPPVAVVYVELAESVVVITPAPPAPELEPELVTEAAESDALEAPAVMTEVPAVRVPETDAVEPEPPLAAARAPVELSDVDFLWENRVDLLVQKELPTEMIEDVSVPLGHD